MNNRLFNRALALGSLLLILSVSTVLAADSVILNGYEITYLGSRESNAVTTLTYAVTADGDVAERQNGGVSHWVLGLPTCPPEFILSPPESPPGYQTVTNHAACGQTLDCLATTYTEVEYVDDPLTGVEGVKFGDAEEQIEFEAPGTHIFEISLLNVIELTDVPVGMKTRTGTSGMITGPVCGGPSAVMLSGTAVQTPTPPSLPILLALSLLGLVTTLNIHTLWRSTGRP